MPTCEQLDELLSVDFNNAKHNFVDNVFKAAQDEFLASVRKYLQTALDDLCSAVRADLDKVFGQGKCVAIDWSGESSLEQLQQWELSPYTLKPLRDFSDNMRHDPMHSS